MEPTATSEMVVDEVTRCSRSKNSVTRAGLTPFSMTAGKIALQAAEMTCFERGETSSTLCMRDIVDDGRGLVLEVTPVIMMELRWGC